MMLLALLIASCDGASDMAGTADTATVRDSTSVASTSAAPPSSTAESGAAETGQAVFSNVLSYDVPGMGDVVVERAVYGTDPAGNELAVELYLPAAHDRGGAAPAVVFVMGYPNGAARIGESLKDHGQYRSWGRLVAASQMVGVAYDTVDAGDTEDVIEFLRTKSAELGIDPERIGLVAVSANVGTALAVAMQPEFDFVGAAVFYYGLMYGPNGQHRETLDSVCAEIHCYGSELADYPAIRSDLPTLVVKAGRDRDDLNQSIDRFVGASEGAGAPITLIDYENGQHGFDVDDNSARSAEIVADTVEFLRSNLS